MPGCRSNRPLACLALAAALGVTGCNKPGDTANATAATNDTAPLPALPATLPMATGAATAAADAPPVAALPAARPIRAVVRIAHSGDAYAYADDAYAFSHAVGNAPPDYGFDYQGTQPWAWQGYDESRTFVEPVESGYRYYYYRPGADTPYFVRDPDYGYGYDDGALAVIYGAGGAILPYADYGPRLGYAARYLQRGAALYQASRGNGRRAVIAANWAARQGAIAASRDRWAAAEAQQAGWQAYRARVADQQAQHWAQEAARRDADARRFASWHDDGFRSAPPPRAIPAAWQQAPWAQDRQRYRVAGHAPTRPPQPAFQRPADAGRPGAAQRPSQGVPTGPGQPQRFVDARPPVAPGNPADPHAAADAARAQQAQAARANDRQQREAQDAQQHGREQQAAAERQQRQTAREAQQAERQQQDVARQADRQQQVAVHIHRGGGEPTDAGGPSRDAERQQPPRAQPPHDDQRQAERQQQQAMHQEQQAAHQQQAAVHQQQAAVQHAQQAQHAPPPHAAPAPHPAAASHPAAAPHPQGGEHGEHRP